MTDTKPRRRWFRFSLRTMFVLVAIVSVPLGWLAYQLNWIRQRHEFVKMLTADREQFNSDAQTETLQGHPSPTIPWVRRRFGDQAYSFIILPEKCTPEMIARANDLFPEALIHRWGGRSARNGGGVWRFTIDVMKHSENKRHGDDYKPFVPAFPDTRIPVKDNRRISIRDESVERAMQADRLSVPRIGIGD